MKLCSSCGQEKDNYEFSKTQWTKTTKERRCCICVSKSAASNFNLETALDVNNNIVTIPAGKSCFVSAGLEDHMRLDQDGNVAIDLDFLDLPSNSASKEPTPMCANPDCKMQDGSLSCCSRCRCISYCSKKCQVDDWQRHKRAECVSPPRTKHTSTLLEPMAPEVYAETVQNASSKMIDSMADLVRSKKAGETDDWKENITSKGLPFIKAHDHKDKMQTFILKYYTQLASFAAVHIAKYPSMKGAVFLFSKISRDDLFDLPPNPGCNHTIGPRKAHLLDRQFVLAWGCRYITGVKDHPKFTVQDLAGKFMDKVQTLPKSMDVACNQQAFPIVFCCDPSGSFIPDCFVDEIRPAVLTKGTDIPVEYTAGQRFTVVMNMRFFDFEAMLGFGMKFPEMDINGLNMDRDYTDPSLR